MYPLASLDIRYQHQCSGWLVFPEVNKFKQVSFVGHQMSLAEGPCTVRSHVLGEGLEGVPVQ